jgi:hypothetical protein
MPTQQHSRGPRIVVIALGLLGALVGQCILLFPMRVHTNETYPPAHHVARQPGGLTLRLAMVHDTLHERYPRHGRAYFEERNRLREVEIRQEAAAQARGAAPTERYFELIDDLAVGHARLGRCDLAISLMRRKLERQLRAGWAGAGLYTSDANLGTFLIQQQKACAFADRAEAKARLREAADLLAKAARVNPEAHFGQDRWELSAAELLLAGLDDPGVLLRFDLLGDRLDYEAHPVTARQLPDSASLRARRKERRAFLSDEEAAERADPFVRGRLREVIPRVGADQGWAEAVPRAHRERAPFDEPVLGIIALWQHGGGADPHLALALGETMLRIDQRYIAWCAFERAALLADHFSPDAAAVRGLVAHGRRRQALIEKSLPAEEVSELRPRFVKELAFGQGYQEERQAAEADLLRAGASLEEARAAAAFEAAHGPIASPVGPEELVITREPVLGFGLLPLAVVLFWAGAFALPAAVVVRLVRRFA